MSLVVGLGVSSAADADAVVTHVRAAAAGAPVTEVRTLDRLGEHPVVRAVAAALGAVVVTHPAEVLAREATTSTSARALAATGTPSVAEAAALVGGSEPLAPVARVAGATVALARAVDLRHHGDADARTAGARVDLAVNVAVAAPPPFVLDAVRDALTGLAAYPDAAPATAHVAAHLGVDPACVLLTNGGAQGFTLLAHARPWQHAVVVHPQFTEPEAALRAAGAPVRRHLLPAPHTLDAARLHAEHPDADLVVVGNPTNPTSVLHPARAVLAARPQRGLLVVDEAFVDTCADPGQSLLDTAARPGSRVVVLRSLTKTFGLAGLRVGLAVGDPVVVARLREVAPPWSVSAPALAAARACASPLGEAFAAAQRARLLANAAHLHAGLGALGLAGPIPQAPFVIAHGPSVPALRDHLRAHGVSTRGCASFPGLGPQHVRLAARDPAVVDPVLDLARAFEPDPDLVSSRPTAPEQP